MAEKTKQGIFARIGRFFRDLRGETKKIVWPSRKQVITSTIVVIVVVIIAAILIGAFDFGLSALINLLFKNA